MTYLLRNPYHGPRGHFSKAAGDHGQRGRVYALRRIDALADGDTPGTKRHPFECDESCAGAYDDADPTTEVDDEVGLSSIVATRPTIQRDLAKGYVDRSKHDPVKVVTYEQRHYLTDGHHRATAAWARGETSIAVKRRTLTHRLTHRDRLMILLGPDYFELERDEDAAHRAAWDTRGRSGESKNYGEVNPAGSDTYSRHTNSDGTFSARRKELHDEIARRYLTLRKPSPNPTTVILGGGPASGKSTVVRQMEGLPKDTVHLDVLAQSLLIELSGDVDWSEVAKRAWDSRGRGTAKTASSGSLRPATSKDAARIKALRVPPAWKDVHISDDHKSALQATGIDDAGRKQYLYSASHSEKKAAEKFARLKAFNDKLPSIRDAVARDIKRGADVTPAEREAATVLYLIDKTAFRVGSDAETGGAVKAYGASTLEARHVSISGHDVTFSFTGKKGVQIDKTVSDAKLAKLLAPRVKAGGKLFDVSDGTIRSYLKTRAGAPEFKVKDFRTWHGTQMALKAMKTMIRPKTKTAFNKAQREVSKVVAAHLGNTPAIAKASYIDPAVWGRWAVK